MASTISPERWLDFVRIEYLESFVNDGGTSVKFVVPANDDLRQEIETGIVERAKYAGYIVARVSSADTRAHMIDQLFYRVSEHVPWRRLSEQIIVKLAHDAGFSEPPAGGPDSLLRRYAEANAIDPDMLFLEARRWLNRAVLQPRSFY